MQCLTVDYSGAIRVYFLKSKSDATHATERFLADSAPYGKIKCLRSDNGKECTNRKFKALLTKNGIRHDIRTVFTSPKWHDREGVAKSLRQQVTRQAMELCCTDSSLHKELVLQ